jgi:hypothetical protein
MKFTADRWVQPFTRTVGRLNGRAEGIAGVGSESSKFGFNIREPTVRRGTTAQAKAPKVRPAGIFENGGVSLSAMRKALP